MRSAADSAKHPVTIPNPTVADWIASGETTIEVFCAPSDGPGCGHHAVVDVTTLDPRMTRSRLCRQARCAKCGKRGATVQRDMGRHYERLAATGWGCDPFKAGG